MSHVAQVPSPPAAAADRPGRDGLWHPRPVLCAVCLRPARGFGFFDPNKRRPRERRWFCSMACQGAFARKHRKEMTVPVFTAEEPQAVPAIMRALGAEMERLGWERPLASLTESDVHRLIAITIEAFRAEMAQIARQSEVPF